MKSLPEEKLLSAVIAQAIEDVCLRPIKAPKESKRAYLMNPDARTAYKFLFTGNNLYLELLNIDQGEFRKRLLSQLSDLSHNKPFDVSTRQNPVAGSRKNCFRLNHRLYEKHERYEPMPVEEPK